MRKSILAIGLACSLPFRPDGAAAQELDTLLPDSIPGYGKPFSVSLGNAARHPQTSGFQLGGLTAIPQLAISQGYDTAPNGAAASTVTAPIASLTLADPILGLGAYAAGQWSAYENNPAQNTSSLTLGLGERAALTAETITLAIAYLRTQETGFSLNTLAIARPIRFTVQDIRGSDSIALGLFTLTPEASQTRYRFPSLASQNRDDSREALTTAFSAGGPSEILVRLHFTQSIYRETALNAQTNQILAGVADTASGIWNLSALAGGATRAPRVGRALTAAVLEARLDWIPTDFDKVRVNLAREIDDPDEVSAAPYTLEEAKFSFTHAMPGDFTLQETAQISNAAFLNSPLNETIFGNDLNLAIPFGKYFGLDADYTFNSRQANQLRAANEHVFTLGATWTP